MCQRHDILAVGQRGSNVRQVSPGRPSRQQHALFRVDLLVLLRQQYPEQARAQRDHIHRPPGVHRVYRLAVVLH